MQPKNLTFIRAGKAIGANKGFADTFNWLVRFCRNLSGDGVTARLDRNNGGDNPVIHCVGMVGEGGGGGTTSGYTTPGGSGATEKRLVGIRWNENSSGKLEVRFADVRYEKGLLKTYVESSSWTTVFETSAHSAEPDAGSDDL